MADNVDITEGSGKTVASDDIQVDGTHAQGQAQFVKLVDGTLNGTGSIRVNQAAKANALTIAPASDISDATYIGDIKFGEALIAGTNLIGKVGIDQTTPGTTNRVDIGALIPGVGATNLGKAEDAGHSSGDTGVMTLTVRQDTAAALGGTDADYQPLITDASGRLHIAPLVAGTAAIGKLAANSGVDIGDVDVTSIIAGVGATNLGKARDSALGATDTGVMALAVRDDTLTTLTPADGDYVPLRVSSTGQLHVTGAGGGTEYTEDVVTANPQVGSAIMIERDDALTTVTPVEADWIGLRGTAEGALWTQDFNSDAVKTAVEAIQTAVEIIDDWDDGNLCNVNINIAGTDCDGGSGAQGAQTLRVILATDDPAVALLTTIDSDTNAIKTAVELLDNAVDGNFLNCNMCLAGNDAVAGEGTIDSNTLRVTIATDDDGVAHLATIAGDTTAIETAIEIIDDWGATHDSAASANGPQLMAAYDATKPAAVTDGDAVRVLADEYGRLLAGVEKTAWYDTLDSGDASAAGVAVKASAASTVLVIQSYVISVDAEMWVHLVDEDDTVLTGKFWLKAGGGVAITLPDKAPIIMGVDKDLEVRTEGAGNISVSVTGYTIPG